MINSRQTLEQLAQSWEQQAADIHGGASADDMSDYGRARWTALRECAQALRAAADDLAESAVVEPAGAASPAELRTALAHYGRHTADVCTLDSCASARHDDCTCGLSGTVDGGPVTAHVRGLVGVGGLGTATPAAARHDPEQMLLACLDYLTRVDTAYLLAAKKSTQSAPPELYASGVTYNARAGFELVDIPAVLRRGAADIDALACWRAAELRAAGVDAEAVLVRIRRKTGAIYTCRVRLPGGAIENVEQKLRESSALAGGHPER